MHPVKAVNTLWNLAEDLVGPGQFCLVIVSDPSDDGTGSAAFRHNCITLEGAAAALREIAGKLETEARSAIALAPSSEEAKR